MPLATNTYTVLKSVRAVCPRCFEQDPVFEFDDAVDLLDGHLVTQDGRVYLRRFCRRGHGEQWSLYEEDVELWQYLQQWRVPTKIINPDTSVLYPLPSGYEYGLGPAHLQHSCIFLLDVTSQCNLACPACFAESSPQATQYLPLENIVRAVRTALEREGGQLDVVMVSGGEPTVHPQIGEILRQLSELPITRILLNTNGIRLANDDGFLKLVTALRQRVEVYLQYDGQRETTQRALRGQDLREVKTRVVGRLSAARVFTTLVMVVAEHNADQIGEVLDTALATDYVGGVMFQPLFGSGRAPSIDPLRRITTTGVLRRIEAQTGGRIRAHDLIALPCSHPDCCSIGYFLRGKQGEYRGLADIIGSDVLRQHLGLFGNSIAFPESMAKLKGALLGLMSESMTLSRPELVKHLGELCSWCDFGSFSDLIALVLQKRSASDFVGRSVKRVTIKHFMDANTLITERLEQCCVHVASAGNEPVRMPFCAARLFPRLRVKALEGSVPRAQVAPHPAAPT